MYNRFVIFIVCIILFTSCANNQVNLGEFGSFEELQNTRCIEQYQYSTVPLDTMYSYLDTIYKKYPKIEAYSEDSLNYTFEYGDRWYRIEVPRNSIIYQIKFAFSLDPYNNEENKRMCVISLTSGRKKGDIMKSPDKLSSEEKELYKKLFEEEFLTKLDSTFNIKWKSY